MTRGDRLWILALVVGLIAFTTIRIDWPWDAVALVTWILLMIATSFAAPKGKP